MDQTVALVIGLCIEKHAMHYKHFVRHTTFVHFIFSKGDYLKVESIGNAPLCC